MSLNISKYQSKPGRLVLRQIGSSISFRSVVEGKSWSLIWEWSALAAIVSGAPSASLAESGTSALPGLRALLGTHPVVGLGDGAVLIVGSSSSVGSPVTLPEGLAVVVVLSGGWDDSVGQTNGWWGSSMGLNGGEQGDEGDEFHYLLKFN
jgi:hypothetical protein